MKYLVWILVFLIIYNPIVSYAEESSIFAESLEDAISMSEDANIDVLAIFTADWCKYCQIMKKDIVNFKFKNKTIIVYIDIDSRTDLYREYKIKNIPHYLIIKNKVEIKHKVGYNKENFERWINE